MNEIKIADISITNFCNFSCEYCIAKSEKQPLILNEDGSIKVIDLRYNQLGQKNMITAARNRVPFENEAYNKTIEGIAHPRGHFLDLPTLLRFIQRHLSGWLITISGGEPLYYPKVDEFLHELTKTNQVVLLTNLSLIHSHKSLLDIPKDKLFFRVGWHPEQRTLNSFIHCLNVLKEHNASCIINYILHPKHIEDGTYHTNIETLKSVGLPYEITRFEGMWKNEVYSCHLPMRDWEQDIIGSFTNVIQNIPTNITGSKFIIIQADGEIFECISKNVRLGNVYENKLRLIPINRPGCFQSTNVCPSIRANYDIYGRFNPPPSSMPS
jgi:pyruvate-formate lyase-activating enzyme